MVELAARYAPSRFRRATNEIEHRCGGVVACLVTPLVGAAQTAVSANAGWTSDYFFRGIFQKGSSASAGLDVEGEYLYAGTWAAGVGDGNEIDFYGGANWSSGDFNVTVGGTGFNGKRAL